MRVLTILSILRDRAEHEEYSVNPEARTMKMTYKLPKVKLFSRQLADDPTMYSNYANQGHKLLKQKNWKPT
jgi:hypothetical protein